MAHLSGELEKLHNRCNMPSGEVGENNDMPWEMMEPLMDVKELARF